MKLTFRCHPDYKAILPKPVRAKCGLPDWLREMPANTWSEVAGAQVRTLKHCPPFIDAMSYGVLMPLTCDLSVKDGAFRWESPLPVIEGGNVGRSPIGAHVPEQGSGAPFGDSSQFIVKFMNYWSIETPKGWSVLFSHPANRHDLPFRTLTGIVDCDAFALGLVHFPAIWTEPDFDGVLPAGTPVAQCYPILRGALETEITILSDEQIVEQDSLRSQLTSDTGVYRKLDR
ncbi:MAG: hypothetical protein KTR19_07010 [Hyphomicrobiales bacterium]|nr:hypothetical protein [Hyphomicrobiales bacterium]